MSKNAYGMSTDDKRIVFTVVTLIVIALLAFAGSLALSDHTWTPLIVAVKILGVIIGTAVFCIVAFKIVWRIAKWLFPSE